MDKCHQPRMRSDPFHKRLRNEDDDCYDHDQLPPPKPFIARSRWLRLPSDNQFDIYANCVNIDARCVKAVHWMH